MTTASRRLLVLAAVVATAGVSACSTPLGGSSAATPAPTTTTIAGASTPAQTKAADLRASLTYLMVEHAYLLGRVTRQVVTTGAVPAEAAGGVAAGAAAAGGAAAGGPAAEPRTTLAGSSGATTTTAPGAGGASGTPTGPSDGPAALDASSKDLAAALSTPYGPQFATQFYSLWAARNADFEAYAQAKVAKSAPAATKATDALGTNATSLATLFHTTNKYIEIKTVATTGLQDELGPVNQAVTDLIDAQAANDPMEVPKLVAAAEKLPHTATVIAAATAKLHPDAYPGTPTGTAANLRATITAALVEHVELASLTLEAVATGLPSGPAAAALGANTQQLTNVFSAVYSDQSGMDFARLWASHIADLVDYARARASNDTSAAEAASSRLNDYTRAFGAYLSGSEATAGRLSAGAVTSDFKVHVDSLLAVTDAAASRAADQAVAVRRAAGHMPPTASSLAEAIAEQFPVKYLP